jgi:recombination protein RecR
MSSLLPKPIENLISQFERLPGIGPKSAERLTFYLLKSKKEDLNQFATAISGLKEGVTICSTCQNIAEQNPCSICKNKARERSIICVVEEAQDALVLENTHEYQGLYHILQGAISPLNNIGPEDLKIKELLERVQKNKETKEIILATNPSLEGEATAMYIAKLLKPLGIKITRIARGLPSGGDLEYADEITLTNALRGRKEY